MLQLGSRIMYTDLFPNLITPATLTHFINFYYMKTWVYETGGGGGGGWVHCNPQKKKYIIICQCT